MMPKESKKGRKRRKSKRLTESGNEVTGTRQRINKNDGLSLVALLPANCSICDDKICHGSCDIEQLPCGHGFGKICIDAWILVNTRCPACYYKVDHESFFQPGSRYYHRTKVYSKAIQNAHLKIGVSGALAGTLVAGGELTSHWLEKVALAASEIITCGATNGIENHRQNNNCVRPMDNQEVVELKRNVEKVKRVAGVTARVTGCMATVVGAGLWALGSMLAPAVSHGSKTLLTRLDMDEEKASRVVDGAMEVAKGAFLSTGQILRGFEHASTVVASSAASNVARMYEFSRGLEPGELALDAGDIAKNVVTTAWNMRALPPKSLAKISRTVQQPYKPTCSSSMEIERIIT